MRDRIWCRRIGWPLFAAAVGILLLAALCVAYFRYIAPALRADTDVERAIKRIAATGAPVEVTQLARPPIADAENAALVYRRAFEVMRLSDAEKYLDGQICSGGASLDDPATATRAQEILRRNAKTLESVRRAAAMPRCDFRVDWSKGNDVTFPQFSKLRSCSHLLALYSLVLAHDGRVDDALAACRDNYRLIKAADEPVIIGPLVACAIAAIACRAVAAVIHDSQPSIAACNSLAAEISGIDLTASFVTALKGERAWGISLFEQVRASPDPVKAVLDLAGESKGEVRHSALRRGKTLARWWLAADELTYLDLMAQAIKEAPLPYRKVVHIHPSVEERVESLPRWPPPVMTAILIPIMSRSQETRDQAIAMLDLAEVALLLKAYRAEHGGYPPTLATVRRPDGRPLPTDPFSGKPFVYRREGAGLLIYSWGPNLKDDGGKVAQQRDEGDIVVRCAR